MYSFGGQRTIRIKKIDDYNIKCENCGKYHQRFKVYQQYFHFMFIPLFPLYTKTIRCYCVECNDGFNEKKMNDYLSMTRAPLYLYLGSILFAGFIVFITLLNLDLKEQKIEFVNNPEIGDVYKIRQEENNITTYYFLKISNIKSDTIDLIHGALQYCDYTTGMDDFDYFVKNDVWKLLKSDLVNYLDNGYILSVERDYNISSRFNIEK